ncbi:type VI secretion system ImpA family N-terminal domain-containing protein [Cupriavidus basilensis]
MLFSAEFDSIQDARRFDDPSLDQGERGRGDQGGRDWRAVIAQSTSLLQNRTKIRRLAAWLAEALSKEQAWLRWPARGLRN